jgi:predicted transcriptional regulator YdeE
MKFDTTQLKEFYIIGISVRTTNQKAQSQKDIGALWQRFFNQNIISRIPGKVSTDIYCMYTDYESDHEGPYTSILGCPVTSLDHVPGEFTGKTIPACKYQVYTSIGKVPDSIMRTWEFIWKSGIDRKYLADFDVYDEKTLNFENAEVKTFISVN